MTNSYLIEAPEGPVLVDCAEGTQAWLAGLGKVPIAILLTHQHFDHTMEVAAIRIASPTPIPVYAHSAFSGELCMDKLFSSFAGMEINVPEFEVDTLLANQSSVEVGGLDLDVFHVPGHSPDSIAFYDKAAGEAYVGDTLMAGSIGRADLPGGSMPKLKLSIREQLLSLPEETVVYAGHGGPTDIGRELSSNPFIK